MVQEGERFSIDRLLTVSVIAGILAAVIKSTLTGFLFQAGVGQRFVLQDAGAIVFRSVSMPLDLPHLILAAITHSLWGGVLGIGLGLVFFITGKRNSILKGMYYGFIVWIVIRNSLISMTIPQGLPPVDAVTTAVYFASHLAWGALAGYMITKHVPFREEAYVNIQGPGTAHRTSFVPAPARRPVPRYPEDDKNNRN